MADPILARRLLREASLELARLRRVRGAYRTTWRRIARAQARLAFAAALLAAAPLAEPAAAADPLFRHGFIFAVDDVLISYSNNPTFADIDGDADLDIFLGDGFGNLVLFANTGSATAPVFGPYSVHPFGLPGENILDEAAPAFVDIDADGDLDAFVGEAYGNTLFFKNTGTATAPAFVGVPSTNPFGLADVGLLAFPAWADIDGDGDLDVFIGTFGGDTIFFENTGTASAPAFATPSTNPFGLADVGDSYCSPAFADIDGDGDLDALIGERSTTFFENTGTASAPAFAAPQTNPFGLVGWGLYESPALADIDGDGDLDALLGGHYANLITAFENTGTPNAPALTPRGNPFGLEAYSRSSPTFTDLDGDGDLDAFVGDQVGNTRFFQNSGTESVPVFAAPVTNPFGLADTGDRPHPTFADIDDDGDVDAFVGVNSGNTIFSTNTGSTSTPAFGAPSANPFGLADVGTYASPALTDIDGDSDLDAFVGSYAGNVLFFENTGTASAPAFAVPTTNPFGLADVGTGACPEFADLDGDGDLDALIGNGDGDSIFFENSGTPSAPAFAAAQAIPFGLADVGKGASPTFADLDGDGDLDAFVGEFYLGRVFHFENVLIDTDACTDGLDNDGDGRIDLGSDAGCANAADTSELSALQCDNGLDDDGDAKIDWRGDGSGDPHCSGLLDNRELPPPPAGPGCGIGPELLLLGPLLAARRRRSAEG